MFYFSIDLNIPLSLLFGRNRLRDPLATVKFHIPGGVPDFSFGNWKLIGVDLLIVVLRFVLLIERMQYGGGDNTLDVENGKYGCREGDIVHHHHF